MSLKLIWLFLALVLSRLKTSLGCQTSSRSLLATKKLVRKWRSCNKSLEGLSLLPRTRTFFSAVCMRSFCFKTSGVLRARLGRGVDAEEIRITAKVDIFPHTKIELFIRVSVILEGLYCSLRSAIDNNLIDADSDSDVRLLQKNMDTAHRRLALKLHEKEFSEMPALTENCYSHNSENDNTSVVPATNQGLQRMVKNMLGLSRPSPSLDEDATVPLLIDEVVMNVDLLERPRRSCSRSLSRTLSTSRLLIMAVMAVGVCFGVCAVAHHHQRIGQIASTIHNCLLDNS